MTQKLKLTLSCGSYEITRALIDGEVSAKGIELTVLSDDRFRIYSLRRRNEVDVGEFNVTEYFRARDYGHPLIALPIYPHRRFRHGYYFVNTASGIRDASDLIGRRGGIPGTTPAAGVWMRGILQDHHGVPLDAVDWRENPLEPMDGSDAKTRAAHRDRGHAAQRRDRRPARAEDPVVVRRARLTDRTAVPRPCRQVDRLLPEDRDLPDHARAHDPRGDPRTRALGGGEHLRRLRRGEDASAINARRTPAAPHSLFSRPHGKNSAICSGPTRGSTGSATPTAATSRRSFATHTNKGGSHDSRPFRSSLSRLAEGAGYRLG